MINSTTLAPPTLDELCINTLRFLAVDMVQKANSGHPGLPLGSAAMAYTLWDRFLKVNPRDPQWPDRDRFVLSAGHGSALLYAILHVTGFDLPLAELKRFRQWGSRTPGHPEYGKTPGVEATTGPLGQGFGNAVGMAIAEVALAARFNRPDHVVVDHDTYVLVSDGDMMEGVASEAASLAGHLRLGKLIALYADNHISLSGGTDLIFTEDRLARFAAYGWHTLQVEDGNDVDAVASALTTSRAEVDRPSFIAVRTHIGYGSPHKHDSSAAHGEPLGIDEVRLTKEHLGWPVEPAFLVPPEASNGVSTVIEIFADLNALSDAAARRFADLAKDASIARGRFSVALAGGTTPSRTYELLAQSPIRDWVPWPKVHVFWGDERCVPADDPRSNYRMARQALLDHVPIPPEQIHPIPCSLKPRAAAERYEALLRSFFGELPRFDLVFLGLGENGHTASLFPGTPVLEERQRWVADVYVAEQNLSRVTLTAPLLNHAAVVVFLVSGAAKAAVLHEVLEGEQNPTRLPAQLIQPMDGELRWLVDRAAASLVEGARGVGTQAVEAKE